MGLGFRPMASDHDINQLLGSLGYGTPQSLALARAHLEAEGLTRAGKQRISDEKLPRVKESLASKFALLCGSAACIAAAARGREVVVAIPPSHCEHCGGSDNKKAFLRLTDLTQK